MELKNNKYQIEGIPVTNLATKYGLPVYVYSTSQMIDKYNKMKKSFRDVNLKINYACKALTNINILKLFNKLGSGLDAVSLQEVHLGIMAGYKPTDIMYTPNCISFSEIEEAVNMGVKVNIDNLSILEQFGLKYGNKVPTSVRLNPHIMAGGNTKISTGHIDSKFGISIYQMPHLLRIIQTHNIRVNGVHMHTGSDILDVDVFLQGIEILLEAAKNFNDIEFIDFGSGFKVPYKPDDIYTDIEDFGKKVSKRFSDYCKERGKDLDLYFEPGKYLVSEAGYFLVKVNVVKHITATVFAGLDTGLNHLIRPMFYDAYHHIINVSKPKGVPRIYTVVGYICETDTFGWNRKINEISEGDILCFMNAGAYCYMMSSNYNSRFRPAEVLVHEGKDYLIRERENMEDLLRHQIEIDI